MAADLTVILANRPGTLASVGEALGMAGVNIDGLCGFPCEGKGVLHIVVEDPDSARRALEGTGHEVRNQRDVLVLDIEDRPGAFGEMTRKYADRGVNIDLSYLATRTRLVIGVDDFEKARDV